MMVIVPRIAAVSYLNTIPFIYGIEHEGNLCAKNFAEHKADIALVPAAAVPSLADAQVVTEYCIGAAGPVRTVVLLSNEPIEKARRVFLDAHSLTSVQLAGYLLAKHWKVTPEYYTLEDYAQLGHALPGDAFLLIGDKVFDHEGRFAYSRYRAHLRSNSRTWFRQQTVRCVCLPYAEYRLYFRQSEA